MTNINLTLVRDVIKVYLKYLLKVKCELCELEFCNQITLDSHIKRAHNKQVKIVANHLQHKNLLKFISSWCMTVKKIINVLFVTNCSKRRSTSKGYYM